MLLEKIFGTAIVLEDINGEVDKDSVVGMVGRL